MWRSYVRRSPRMKIYFCLTHSTVFGLFHIPAMIALARWVSLFGSDLIGKSLRPSEFEVRALLRSRGQAQARGGLAAEECGYTPTFIVKLIHGQRIQNPPPTPIRFMKLT
jgi:hypothetical protein